MIIGFVLVLMIHLRQIIRIRYKRLGHKPMNCNMVYCSVFRQIYLYVSVGGEARNPNAVTLSFGMTYASHPSVG